MNYLVKLGSGIQKSLLVVSAIALVLSPAIPQAALAVSSRETITICHATNSHSNPYNSQNPSKTADAGGHDGHEGEIWYEGIEEDWGDIIPPFDYDGGSYPGKNWVTGEAIWNNDCEIPEPDGGPTTGNLTVTKNTVGGNATFAFTGTSPIVGFEITTVDATGTAQLTDLPAGTYTITEGDLPDGWSQTSSDCEEVLVVVGETATCTIENTFTSTPDPEDPTFTVSGMKFNDENGNGVDVEDGEEGIEGIEIIAYQDEAVAFNTTTNSDGNYSLEGLTAGDYWICEGGLDEGWEQTYPTDDGEEDNITTDGCYMITITNGSIDDLNFGNHLDSSDNSCRTGSISGTFYDDDDEDGVWDEGEAILVGWTVKAFLDENENGLRDEGETEFTTETNAEGMYSFTTLVGGQYVVSEVLQSGWIQITPNAEANFVSILVLECPLPILEDFQLFIAALITGGNVATGYDFGNNQIPVTTSGGGGGGGGGGTPFTPPIAVVPDTAGEQIEDGEVLGEQITGDPILPVTGTQAGSIMFMIILGYLVSLAVKRQVAIEKE